MANKRNFTTDTADVKVGRLTEAQQRYSLGRASLERAAAHANAIIHFGRCKLYDFDRLDEYFRSLAGDM